MNLRRSAALTIAGLLVSGLVAACGTGAAPTPTPTATPAPSRVDITGTMRCPGTPSKVICELKMSDPRASGTEEMTLSLTELPDGSVSESAPSTLKSAGGTWDCQGVGIQNPNGVITIDEVCAGRAAFSPLTLYLHAISGNSADTASVTGSIERP